MTAAKIIGWVVIGILVVGVGGFGISAIGLSYWDDWKRKQECRSRTRSQMRRTPK